MNASLNFFDEKRLIFTFVLMVGPASLAEAITTGNADMREPRCSKTRATSVAIGRQLVSSSKTPDEQGVSPSWTTFI